MISEMERLLIMAMLIIVMHGNEELNARYEALLWKWSDTDPKSHKSREIMTVEELIQSKYGQRFDLEYGALRPDILTIHFPQHISIDMSDEWEIKQFVGSVEIRTKTVTVTLYYLSTVTHTVIF